MSDAIYSVTIKGSAAKALQKINANDRRRLVEAICSWLPLSGVNHSRETILGSEADT